MTELTAQQKTEFEAAAFRHLFNHLSQRDDVQNIDLTNLAGFCRNCLANRYLDAATAAGTALTMDGSREHIYGMPYDNWAAPNRAEASDAQRASFEANRPKHD